MTHFNSNSRVRQRRQIALTTLKEQVKVHMNAAQTDKKDWKKKLANLKDQIACLEYRISNYCAAGRYMRNSDKEAR